jgi:hypothetical protein
MPDLMKFFLEVGPIFMAFSFFAMAMFNHQARYDNLTEVLISMLCIMAGDEIQPSLEIFSDAAGLWGTIFGMIYTLIFFVIVQNMMVLVFTNGYEKAMKFLEEDEQKLKKAKILKIRQAKQTTTQLTGITQQESIDLTGLTAFAGQKQVTQGKTGAMSPTFVGSNTQSGSGQKLGLQRFKTVMEKGGSPSGKFTGLKLVRQGSHRNLTPDEKSKTVQN